MPTKFKERIEKAKETATDIAKGIGFGLGVVAVTYAGTQIDNMIRPGDHASHPWLMTASILMGTAFAVAGIEDGWDTIKGVGGHMKKIVSNTHVKPALMFLGAAAAAGTLTWTAEHLHPGIYGAVKDFLSPKAMESIYATGIVALARTPDIIMGIRDFEPYRKWRSGVAIATTLATTLYYGAQMDQMIRPANQDASNPWVMTASVLVGVGFAIGTNIAINHGMSLLPIKQSEYWEYMRKGTKNNVSRWGGSFLKEIKYLRKGELPPQSLYKK